MQVKKFEAKTMKEALELVKVHMGPEAIILSARDSHRGFGLMGEKSVEVTAAVSDETLRKKKIAEGKMREDLRQRFQKIPAAKQKEFIDRVFREREELVTAGERAQLSGVRYADIPDEEAAPRSIAAERIRRAAESAKMAGDILRDPPPRKTSRRPSKPAGVQKSAPRSSEVAALELQVRELKSLVERFQKIPQIPPSLHPGADQGLPFELTSVYQRLTQQGIHVPLVSRMLKKAMKEIDAESLKKPALVEAWIVGQLLNSIEVCKPQSNRYHVFMGTTGQGKTSSLVKCAAGLVMKERKTIAIVSLDTMKVGAADQLRIYAQILNVPFAIVRSPDEWRVAEQKLRHVQHILVDCPGLTLKTMEEADWLRRMIPPAELDRRLHYVQSILARDEEAMDIASRHQMVGFHDVIFTRLDESARQGLMLNFQERFRVPLHSFGLGPKIPEDFEPATKERVIDFIFKLTKRIKKDGDSL
jgi:flagellar biosynthesis protein FlhF